jgi:hypothetical protein
VLLEEEFDGFEKNLGSLSLNKLIDSLLERDCFLLWTSWYFVVTGILPLAKQSLSNEVMIIMCMSSKADKLCNSKHYTCCSFFVESGFIFKVK